MGVSTRKSLSKWNPLLSHQPPVRHGEKLKDFQLINQIESVNLLESLVVEPNMLHCVNPYDINPMSGVRPALDSTEGPSLGKAIKLEMEEFSDLAPYLRKATLKTNSVDELNTPVFDRKEPFDFMINENTYIQLTAAEEPFKFEYDTLRTANSMLPTRQQLNSISVYPDGAIAVQKPNFSDVVNTVQGSEANLLFSPSESDQGDIYIFNGNQTPTLTQNGELSSVFKLEDNSVVSVNSIDNQYSNVSSPSTEYFVNGNVNLGSEDRTQYSNVPSPSNDFNSRNLGIDTPEDSSNGSSCTRSDLSINKVPRLKLNMDLLNPSFIPNTPDVIESVVSLENAFNILDYIDDKDIVTVNVEDIHFESSSLAFRGLNVNTGIDEVEGVASPKVRSKRRTRCYDDEDADYVPPPKKQKSRKVKIAEETDTDSDFEASRVISMKGRPPTRTSSFSSDHSDASKYRELRDKNNEASRKSRLKRKMKEMTLETESDELREKNVKLRAQVEELEKMVTNFRNNLFKIMLKK